MVVTVRFRPGTPFKTAEAPKVERALERVARPDGMFEPQDVVDAARPASSVLHPYFEWDDSEAAREYRLWQARNLTRAVEVRVLTADNAEHWVPKFNSVMVQTDAGVNERRYATLAVVKQQPDLIAQVQQRLEDELLACKRRYEAHAHIPEFHQRFAEVFDAVDRLALVAD
jgi:hypothetical protein